MSGLPAPVRVLTAAITDAVEAVRARDADAFAEASGALAALSPERTGLVLGAVIRSMLEDAHPDGLDGDDVQAVLHRCVRSTVTWYPDIDVTVLIAVLTGALGVHQLDDEETKPPRPVDFATHAPLLVADLLGPDATPIRPLADYLRAAFGEIARAETMEMP